MPSTRARDERLEVRTTPELRRLIERAVEVTGGTLTGFVEASLTEHARRVLADRDRFTLAAEAAAAWDEVNAAPPRELTGVRRLLERPSPFSDGPTGERDDASRDHRTEPTGA